MEDREMPRMHKYGESKTIQIMMATVLHVTSSSGLRKFQAAWFLLNRGYKNGFKVNLCHQQQQNIFRSLSEVPDIFVHF